MRLVWNRMSGSTISIADPSPTAAISRLAWSAPSGTRRVPRHHSKDLTLQIDADNETGTSAVKTFTLPGTSIVVSNVVLGMMRISDKSDDEVRALVRAARDAGIDFVDHADIYGPPLHGC